VADVVTTVEVYHDVFGEWRWRARAGNGEIVADSAEGYVDKGHAVEMARLIFPDEEPVEAPAGRVLEKSGSAKMNARKG
jgi:uncharacterized protein YegP (UPF0339 family)